MSSHAVQSAPKIESKFDLPPAGSQQLPIAARKNTLVNIAVALIALLAFAVPAYSGSYLVNIGQGPDELDHIDYSLYLLAHPDQPVDVERGFKAPGFGPTGQGHQAPLSYWLGAKWLSLFLDQSQFRGFADYRSGLTFSYHLGSFLGPKTCMTLESPVRGKEPEVQRFRFAIHALRSLQALYLAGSVICTFLLARLIFQGRPWAWLSAALLMAGLPNAVWRSTYVSNDNLVAFLGAAILVCGAFIILKKRSKVLLDAVMLGALAGLCFLAKYNGVVALGIACSAVLLRPQISMPRRIAGLCCVVIAFALCVAPDLLNNYRIDGDIFSVAAMIHTVPFLHLPSTVGSILQDPYFLKSLVERFWIEFHNIAALDTRFPLVIWDFWSWFLKLGAIAIAISLLFYRRLPPPILRMTVYLIVSVAGMFAVIIYGAATFPLPGGRYLHPVAPAFAVLSVFACTALIQCFVPRWLYRADVTVAAIAAGLWVFGNGMTAVYFKKSFSECVSGDQQNVQSGVDLAAADLDRDGIDELVLHHRHRTRVYFAKLTGGTYAIVPEWTRRIGLQGDQLAAGDIDQDGFDEIVLRRPLNKNKYSYSAEMFLTHDTGLSRYSDLATTDKPYVGPMPSKFPELRKQLKTDGNTNLIAVDESANRISLLKSLEVRSDARLEHVKAVPVKTGVEEISLAVLDKNTGLVNFYLPEGPAKVVFRKVSTFDPGWYSAAGREQRVEQ